MVAFYDINKIDFGEEPSYSGHTVYKKARYEKKENQYKKIIYKLNKHDNPNLSRLEVGFSAVLSRFLLPDLTPKQKLVKEKKQIVGVASDHYCYAAFKREGADAVFCSLNKKKTDDWGIPLIRTFKPKKADDIPVYFLDEFASGFFATLWEKYRAGGIDFDMASLASVLTSSYTLEEDDLHKGNFGFYLVKKRGRTVVVFFKIDNDLMLADSLMSTHGSRITNWRHADHAFDITARDLMGFPKLIDSQNHYWPTSRRYLTHPTDSKVYTGFEDIPAFTELARSKAFRYAKWREFYKHTLIPPSVIAQSLRSAFDCNDAGERAQLSAVQQAVIARQAKLRAVLFSLPAFRSFVRQLSPPEQAQMKQEILHDVDDRRGTLAAKVSADMKRYQFLCESKNGFAPGDTPLHVAIRLKDYRYHETWNAFREFAERVNGRREKPLDVAVAMTKRVKTDRFTDPREDPFFTIKALLREGVAKTESYRAFAMSMEYSIENYRFRTGYLYQAARIKGSQGLLKLMRSIGEDYSCSLKMRKQLSLSCLRRFIHVQRKHPDFQEILQNIKLALNGSEEQEPAPELQFIRQLRSRLWIVRQIRGFLGGTETQITFNAQIDEALRPFQCCGCASSIYSFFFGGRAKKAEPVDEIELSVLSV